MEKSYGCVIFVVIISKCMEAVRWAFEVERVEYCVMTVDIRQLVLCTDSWQLLFWMFHQTTAVFKTSFNCWLFCRRIGEFFLCCRIMMNILQPVTVNILFVSSQWEEVRLNLVSTHFMCTQCLVLCLTGQADLSVMVIIGRICVCCERHRLQSCWEYQGSQHETHWRDSFVGQGLLLAVNWRNMGFHIQERSNACAWHVARDTYSVEIYGDTCWVTQVKTFLLHILW